MKKVQMTIRKQAKKISMSLLRKRLKRDKTKKKEVLNIERVKQRIESSSNNLLTTNEAILIVKEIGEMSITLKTLLTWIVKYKMGRKIGGRWVIYRSMFIKFLNEGSKSV